jgi:hypothetical protein
MMQNIDQVSLDAFARLLSRPDPSDLPRRSHVRRCEGDPDRRTTRLPGILMGWLQRRHLAADLESQAQRRPVAEPAHPESRTAGTTETAWPTMTVWTNGAADKV